MESLVVTVIGKDRPGLVESVSATTGTLLGVTAAGTLFLGIFPGSVLSLDEYSVNLLFAS